MPTWTATDGRLVLDADRDEVEADGIVVLTILGMKELSIIADTTSSLEQRNSRFSFHENPEDDAATMETFRTADTDGVFGFRSKGMKEILTRARPESRSDLLSLNGAYRQPFIQDGTVGELVRRMRNPSGLNQDRGPGFPDDDLTTIDAVADVLDDTYGLLLFQEQFIEIVHRLTGWSYLVSELYRRRVKTTPGDEILQDELIAEAGKTVALSEHQEHQLRALITRSRQTVLKAHAVAYTRVGWMMAYLQAHYRDQFLASFEKTRIEADSH